MDSSQTYWLFVFGILLVPYSWLLVRVASVAYFQAKLDYQEYMFRKLEKENYSD